MKQPFSRGPRLLFIGLLAVIWSHPLSAAKTPDDDTLVGLSREKEEVSFKNFQDQKALAAAGGISLVFLGDSITKGWLSSKGKALWDKYFAPLKAANMGVSGDKIQHVLWRVENGTLDGMEPKLLVLAIGTNNTGRNTVEEIVAGVAHLIEVIRKKLPKTKILIVDIFMRGEKADERWNLIRQANEGIAKLADGNAVTFLKIGQAFIHEDGTLLRKELFDKDNLHPSPEGFSVYAENLAPVVAKMMAREN